VKGRCLATSKVVMIVLWDSIMFSLGQSFLSTSFSCAHRPKLQDEISKTCHECDMSFMSNFMFSLCVCALSLDSYNSKLVSL